jgi:hypothetical protein
MVYGAIAFIAVAVLVFASSDRAMRRLDLAVISGLLLTMLVLILITPNR